MANKISRWFLKWAHNKKDDRESDVSSEPSKSDDEDLLTSAMHNDRKIEDLRQAAIKCKSSFVTLKHNLMYLVSNESTSAVSVDRKCVQEALDEMLEAQATSVNILTELSQIYGEKGNVELMQTVSDDMEWIHRESSEAQSAVFRCVCSSDLVNSNEQNQKSHDLGQKIATLQAELDRLRNICAGYEYEINKFATRSKTVQSDANSPGFDASSFFITTSQRRNRY